MRNPRGIGFLLGAGLFLAPYAYAAAGADGAAFLNIPVGAEPAALGSAYTALADNAYAPTWNPAGLGFLKSPEVAGQHLFYLESLSYDYGSFTVPLSHSSSPSKLGALGVSVQYLGSGDITARDVNGVNTGNYSSHFAAYTLAYGQKVTDRFSLGLATKFIDEKISNVSATAYAVDLGAMYKCREDLTLAGTVTNIGNKLTFLSESDNLPMAFHFGGAYQPVRAFQVSMEGDYQREGTGGFRTGLEWRPIEAVALRTGYRTDTLKELSPLAGFSTGMGLYFWGQEFSYAWVPYGDLGDTQYISLRLRFGPSTEENKNLTRSEGQKLP